MLQEFWNLISSRGFPAFSFLTAATISERRMAGSLQWLGPKVGALRQEESMVGWWLYSAFPYSNHLCFTSSGLERSSPLLLWMELDVGLLSIPLVIVLMVLKTSLLLFCCMFVSSIWHFPLNHISLSALWIDLVRWLYSWQKLGSWIAFFLAFLLSSVSARVASEIHGFSFGLGSLRWDHLCLLHLQAIGIYSAVAVESPLLCWGHLFHFFLLRPFFSTLNFTLILARTREWSDPMSTLWNDLVLSTADLHLTLIRIKSIVFFDLWSGVVQVHLQEGLCLKRVLDTMRLFSLQKYNRCYPLLFISP